MKGRLGSSIAIFITWLCTAFLTLPFITLILHLSLRDVWTTWSHDAAQPLLTSLWTTGVSMVLILLFGTPAGWFLSRRKGVLWRIIEILFLIPLLMPPLVIGLLLVYFYGPYGFIGEWLSSFGASASNTALAVVLAQLYESLPYYVFTAQAAFSQIDGRFERASLSLGASPLTTMAKVIFPLARPGLVVGLAMAFARAIGAFGAVIVVAYYPHTLPVGIWISLSEQGLSTALPMALLLLVVALPLPLTLLLWRRWNHAEIPV